MSFLFCYGLLKKRNINCISYYKMKASVWFIGWWDCSQHRQYSLFYTHFSWEERSKWKRQNLTADYPPPQTPHPASRQSLLRQCSLLSTHSRQRTPITVTNVMSTGKLGVQPIPAVTIPVKKIKGTAGNVMVKVTELFAVDAPLLAIFWQSFDYPTVPQYVPLAFKRIGILVEHPTVYHCHRLPSHIKKRLIFFLIQNNKLILILALFFFQRLFSVFPRHANINWTGTSWQIASL